MLNLLTNLLLFVPLIGLMWLANLADLRLAQDPRRPFLARALITVVILFFACLVPLGVWLQVGAHWIQDGLAQYALFAGMEQINERLLADPIGRQVVEALPRVGLGVWVAGLLGLLLLLKPIRRALTPLIPIDPERTVHTVAVSFAVLILLNLVVTLGIGLDTLTDALITQAAEGQSPDLAQTMLGLWSQQIMTAILALFGVGWLSRRSLGQTLARLGLSRPGPKELVLGFGSGLGLVFVVAVMSGVAGALGVMPDPDVQSLTGELLGPLLGTLPGILTIGLAAAIGEETIFRGALQPRFGLWLTTLLFALVHGNYGLSLSTLIVFVVGLGFGLLRRHHNTTTAMIAHATYNTTIGLLGLLALRLLEGMG